jgi:hypothetical protein
VAVVVAALIGLAGCGESGPKIYPVRGQVVVTDGDVKQLAGCNIDFQQEGNSKVWGYGLIEEDGRFALGIRHEGKRLSGVPEGTYQVRIQGSEDNPPRVHKRYQGYATSGLSFQVPTEGDLTLTVSRK